MGAQPFTPKSDKAIWADLYALLRQRDYGTLITYAEIADLTGRDARIERGPIYRAMKELERNDKRTLICERNVGYRIALPAEHRPQADRHRRRSYRQIVRARRRIASAPRDLLTADERGLLDEMDLRLSQHEMALRNLNRRTTALETKTTVHEDSLAEIRAAISELKAKGILAA